MRKNREAGGSGAGAYRRELVEEVPQGDAVLKVLLDAVERDLAPRKDQLRPAPEGLRGARRGKLRRHGWGASGAPSSVEPATRDSHRRRSRAPPSLPLLRPRALAVSAADQSSGCVGGGRAEAGAALETHLSQPKDGAEMAPPVRAKAKRRGFVLPSHGAGTRREGDEGRRHSALWWGERGTRVRCTFTEGAETRRL